MKRIFYLLLFLEVFLSSCSKNQQIEGCYKYKSYQQAPMTGIGLTQDYEFCFYNDGSVIIKDDSHLSNVKLDKTEVKAEYKVIDEITENLGFDMKKTIYVIEIINPNNNEIYLIKFNPKSKRIKSLKIDSGVYYENDLKQ